ncbi:antibiotic biosynthesis monooxygenase family protein [Halalkalibacterium halodurans]|jgi:heme oxygenase (staphylobilin-producing)|uniref:Antibiotic biosynthesis monooxygenase n=1 Tax=Halalkalibacterium halodurans TaxID=86665 RepID=A0A0M0KF34_ALKHA|nr:antibiotic biosynthesis monooxygenase [Halalkalibacterium halodurans]TPE67286.1 antibiotic biosynthesis monooxygenase [Halalkalibacterium halodurans]
MFFQVKTLRVEEGHSDKIVEKFASKGLIEEQPGFIDMNVLRKKQRRGDEEVVVIIRWESEEAWKAWEKSDAHLAGHRENRGKPKPSYILDGRQDVYEVLAKK